MAIELLNKLYQPSYQTTGSLSFLLYGSLFFIFLYYDKKLTIKKVLKTLEKYAIIKK